jgi:hypothetical protein
MMMVAEERAPGRREIEDLLPWHAAGTLNHRDAVRVEEALARDPDLAHHFEVVREELAATINLNETLGAPSARAMEKLFASIDAEPVRSRSIGSDFSLKITDFLSRLAPRTVAWAAAAAAVAIVLQAGVIANLYVGQRSYEVAGVQPQQQVHHRTAAAVDARADALIRFAPQASADEMTKFLESYKATVVDGPMSGGLYRIRIANTSKDELNRIIARMQENKAVVGFVGTAQ